MSTAGLEELRARIDELDETVIVALAERFVLSRQTLDRKYGAVHDPVREAAVLDHVADLAERCGMAPGHAMLLYEVVLRVSAEIQDQSTTNNSV